jgi:hypothetical protein
MIDLLHIQLHSPGEPRGYLQERYCGKGDHHIKVSWQGIEKRLNLSIRHDCVENCSSRQDSEVGNFTYLPSHIQSFMTGLRRVAAAKSMGAEVKLCEVILYHGSFPWVVAHVGTCGKSVHPLISKAIQSNNESPHERNLSSSERPINIRSERVMNFRAKTPTQNLAHQPRIVLCGI